MRKNKNNLAKVVEMVNLQLGITTKARMKLMLDKYVRRESVNHDFGKKRDIGTWKSNQVNRILYEQITWNKFLLWLEVVSVQLRSFKITFSWTDTTGRKGGWEFEFKRDAYAEDRDDEPHR